MARAVEAAHRAGATLEAAHRELRAELKPEHRRTLDDFIALAGAGPGALIEQAAEPQTRARADRVIAAYEALAAAAAAVPRMREMREYLRATELMPDIAGDVVGDDAAVDKAVAAAQVECQLLLVALDSGVPRWEPRGFDVIEVRFQKFKWNYIQLYQAAHERWRRENERMTIELGDAREHFGALSRLNSIAALGASIGGGLGSVSKTWSAGSFDAPSMHRLCSIWCRAVRDADSCWARRCRLPSWTKSSKRSGARSRPGSPRFRMTRSRGSSASTTAAIGSTAFQNHPSRPYRRAGARSRRQSRGYLERLLEEVPPDARDGVPHVIEPFVRSRREGLRNAKRAARAVKPRPE